MSIFNQSYNISECDKLTFLSVTNRYMRTYYTTLTWSEPRLLIHSVKIGEMTGFKKKQQQQQKQNKQKKKCRQVELN